MVVDLSHYASDFSKTSYDGMKKKSLIVNDYYTIYNFDDVAKDMCQCYRAGEYLASADALSFSSGEIFLIEFKNQPTRNIDRRVIQKKAFDSLYLLQHAVFPNASLDYLSKHTTFYVIHAGSSNPSFDNFKRRAGELAKQKDNQLDFGLSRFKEFYKGIYTVSAKEFIAKHLENVV